MPKAGSNFGFDLEVRPVPGKMGLSQTWKVPCQAGPAFWLELVSYVVGSRVIFGFPGNPRYLNFFS